MDHDSDNEIELALAPANAEDMAAPDAPATAAVMSPPAMPAPPAPVDDLSLIQQMVESGAVVGAMPAVDMSAAEKRKLVEASMGIAKPTDTHAAEEAETMVDEANADLSESSSEFESDDDEPVSTAPLTAAEVAAARAELEAMGVPLPPPVSREVKMDDESEDDSSSEDESEDDILGRLGFENIPDSDDELDTATNDLGVMSVHEQPMPPVPQPPTAELPKEVQLAVAGEVVSWMKERGLEAWLEKQKAAEEEKAAEPVAGAETAETTMAETAATVESTAAETPVDAAVETPATDVAPEIPADAPPTPAAKPAPAPKFGSAGTVIVRAQHLNGSWLEAGSVLAFGNHRVLGTVFDVFGPLTSPFYAVRLPPPPYPYPTAESLEAGSKVYSPQDSKYRTFVDMHAVRDPRYRSDASNVFDEEVGDDEREWSDDEAEAAAKRRRKQDRKGSKAPSASTAHGLPARPHFDYAADEDGPLHGEDIDDNASTMSTASQRGIISYDDGDAPSGLPPRPNAAPRRGRGQRDQRGGRGRGATRGQGRSTGPGRHALPQRPDMQGGFGYAPQQFQQFQPGFGGFPQQQQQFQGGFPPGFNPGFQQGYAPQQQYGAPGFQGGGYMPYAPSGYVPDQPGLGMPNAGEAPAINPRFAAQMMGGYWPQGQGQEGQHGQEGQGGHGGHGGHGQGYSE